MHDGDVILADDREASKAWCVDRQELFSGDSSLGFRTEMFAHFSSPRLFWAFLAGYVLDTKGVGDVRPACLFPLVKSKFFLHSGSRRCSKDGHCCMKMVIDCSSVLHKMAWRSVARAIRAASRVVVGIVGIPRVWQIRVFQLVGGHELCCRGAAELVWFGSATEA